MLPRRPPDPARPGFPLLAVLAPLIGAAVLFAIVRSPIMLAFAALSPVIAVAGTIDGRLSAGKKRRTDARSYAAETERYLVEVAAEHEKERAALNALHPPAAVLLTDPAQRPRRWRETGGTFARVRIATGSTTSMLAVSGSGGSAEERALLLAARRIDDCPILADAGAGIGLVGVLPVARAVLRGIVVQLAHAHPPGTLAITAPAGEEYDWLDDYPYAVSPQREPLRLRIVDAASGSSADGVPSPRTQAASDSVCAVIAAAERVDDLPTGCHLVAAVDPDGRLTVLSPPEAAGEYLGEFVTAHEAEGFGRHLAAVAKAHGVGPGRSLPDRVRFSDLPPAGGWPSAGGERSVSGIADQQRGQRLAAVVGVTTSGPLELDLVSSGPHAIVTGTTGSGKSELLITWVLAMAASTPAALVNFLLVDFKGGTAFRRLAGLPHTVGVVTDLAHGEAARALKSLRAELRRRESELARLRASDIAEVGEALCRLVIVVDEAAAMFAAFPELGDLFSDIAARGRALGVHLILGTQRATGVLGDALLANCSLRLSLRVAAESDSAALLGTDAAARLPHSVPGRLVALRDGELLTGQAATAAQADVGQVRAATVAAPGRAPWLPALPDRVPLSAFGAAPVGSVIIGVRDDPDRQVQEGILYRPEAAHLLVTGVRGTGKSTVVATIRSQFPGPAIAVPPDVEGAWDALQLASSLLACEQHACGRLVLIDDVDALLDRFGDDHRDAATDVIRSLLVDGPLAGIGVVCTASVLPGGLRGMSSRFGERLLLRQADRQEHVLAGAPPELFDADAPPGRGVWRDRAAQVALPLARATLAQGRAENPEPLRLEPGVITIVVARDPAAAARRLHAAFPDADVIELADAGPQSGADAPLDRLAPRAARLAVADHAAAVAVIGDPDAWQANWALLGRIRAGSCIVFDGCTLTQVRAILHSRVLPPPAVSGHLIVCGASGEFFRASLPA